MPKIVSNTTPIISLLKVNRLDLLQRLYKQIYIPSAVYKEIEAGKAKGYYYYPVFVGIMADIEMKFYQSELKIPFIRAGIL